MLQFYSLVVVLTFNAFGEEFSLYNEDFPDRPQVIKSVADLRALFVENQFQFLPIAPPSDDVYLHSYDHPAPVNWKNFPQVFKQGILPEINEYGLPIYNVTIYEDVLTRETVFLNALGVEFYRVAPKKGYNPYAFQMNRLGITNFIEFEPLYDWWLDPAKIAAKFTLIPNQFYDYHVAFKDEEHQKELSMMRALQ